MTGFVLQGHICVHMNVFRCLRSETIPCGPAQNREVEAEPADGSVPKCSMYLHLPRLI